MDIRSGILIYIYIPYIFASSYLTDRELRQDLLKGYSKDVRPVQNIAQNLNIDLHFKSIVIYNLDLFEGILHSKIIIESRWTDEYLRWDPIKYDNLTHIEFNSESIWAPNIFVSNAEKASSGPGMGEYITVRYDGRTSYFIRSIYRTYCSIDFYKYPFSVNECKLYFWLSNEMVSHLKLQNIDFVNTTSIWTTSWNVQLDGQINKDDNSTDGFELIVMLERTSSANNIAIVIGILLLSLLTMCVFLLPAESGEKVTFSTTLFLTNILYLVESGREISTNGSAIPLYLLYILILTTVSSLSCVGSIFICRLYQHAVLEENQNEYSDDRCKKTVQPKKCGIISLNYIQLNRITFFITMFIFGSTLLVVIISFFE